MKHNFIIISRGKIARRVDELLNNLIGTIKNIYSHDLVPTKYIMNKRDYDDIVAWSKTLPIK